MQRLSALGALAAVALFLASCTPAPGLNVTLASTSQTLIRGESTTLDVTITRSGSISGNVTLGVAGLPVGVVAAFADDTLDAAENGTTLTIDVTPAAVEGSVTLTANAVAAGLAGSATFDLEITSLTVDGQVLDLLGNGLTGVQVAIQGTTDTSDADGNFSIGGVAVPYDLATFYAGTQPVAHVFVGMTDADPVLLPYAALIATMPPTGTIDGNLSAPVPAGETARVCAAGLSLEVIGCDTVIAGATAYSISASWPAGSSASVRLHALVGEYDADGLPVGYSAYGTADGSVANGGATTIDVTLGGAPSTTTLAASMNRPAGLDPDGITVGARLSDTATLPLFTFAGAVDGFSGVPVPTLGGVSYGVYAVARSATGASSHGWEFGLGGGTTTTIDLPIPPSLIGPADGATGIGVGDTLTIGGGSTGAYTFVLTPLLSELAIGITTMDSSASIPDLSGFGVALPASTAYNWAVIVTPGMATVEDAGVAWIGTYYEVLLALESGGGGSPTGSGSIMATESRGFATP
jgi:hypothetical protein